MRVAMSGLFGFGTQLREAMAPAGLEVVRGYHPDLGRAALWDERRLAMTWQEAVEDPRVEACVIASPTPAHAEQIAIALYADKPVFVEKPLVSTSAQLAEIERLWAPRRRVPFMVGHKARRATPARAIKALLDAGILGVVLHMSLHWAHDGGRRFPHGAWRADQRRHREGPLQTLGVHLIDLVHYWGGPLTTARARLQNRTGCMTAPDTATVLLTLASGAQAVILTSYVQGAAGERIEVHGTRGSAIWTGGMDGTLTTVDDCGPVPHAARPIDPVVEELREFRQAVETGWVIETDFGVGAAAVLVLEACARSSAAGGRPVEVPTTEGVYA